MKRKNRILALAALLAGGVSALAGCDTNSSGDESFEPLPDGALSYLKGTFYGGGGTLTVGEDKLTLDGENALSLFPTSVGAYSLSDKTTSEEPASEEVTAVYFDAAYNGGTSYCLYADVLGDGFLHLSKKVGDGYEAIASFQPNVSKYAAPYSADGGGSEYNFYYCLDSDFDFKRNAYPFPAYHPYSASYSSEQSWYALSRIRLDSDKEVYYTIEFFDSDDYGWGEYQLVVGEDGYELYDREYEYAVYYADVGAFHNLTLFDDETKNSVQTTLSTTEKTFSFGDKSGNYTVNYDDEGMRLNVAFGNETAAFRFHDHYLTYEANDVTKIYPLDDVSELEGTYTDKVNTVSFALDWDTYEYGLKWNGQDVSYTYATRNNRKSLSFAVDGEDYVLSPDKGLVSVHLLKGEEESYFINAERFDALFTDTFVAHDESNDFTLRIDGDFHYTLKGESGDVIYQYDHGDKYPSLVFQGSADNKMLYLSQEDIGLYKLTGEGSKDVILYSQQVLDKVYGQYSSNGKDSLVINADSIMYNGKYYDYQFAPSFNEGLGIYYFGISSSLGDFVSNLLGCVYNDDTSFVSKDIFTEIAGTYSLYGKYGIESIKFTTDGDLFLDTVNEAGDGLDTDVPYEYQIITVDNYDGNIAVVGFYYGGYTIFIYVYADYVKIVDLNYYENSIMNTWGVYVDAASENILYVNDNKLYWNGSSLTINSKTETNSGLVYDTSAGTIVFNVGDDDAYATVIAGGAATSLTRKYEFPDYNKFVGEYSANSTTVKFEKTVTSYQATIGSGLAMSLSDLVFVLKDGKVAIQIPSFFDKYYLIMDDSTNTVSCEYVAGTLPPLPPAPPSA